MTDHLVSRRITERRERVHINTGAVCNNNCIFCMEEDRDGRYVNNSAITPEVVRGILEMKRGAEEVCFTSGEPTTNPNLAQFVRWAKECGYHRISIMSNGRLLGYDKYLRSLLAAGMNRFYISIHGHNAKLHEGLTRAPGSFKQTVAGIDNVARFLAHGVELHTSTVITDRNVGHFLDVYRFLRAHGVEQVVFNVMQANGRANTFFEQIFPSYSTIAESFQEFMRTVTPAQDTSRPGQQNERVMAFLVDIPLCTTEGIADFNRGYVEKHVHYDLAEEAEHLFGHVPEERRLAGDGKRHLVELSRADVDGAYRDKRAECASCRYHAVCEGVWKNYTRRLGWEEFRPVPLEPARHAAVSP